MASTKATAEDKTQRLVDALNVAERPSQEDLIDLDLEMRTHQKEYYKKLARDVAKLRSTLEQTMADLHADVRRLLEVETARAEAISRWFAGERRVAIRASETLNAELFERCKQVLEDDSIMENAIDHMEDIRSSAALLVNLVRPPKDER